jgi:hypothetical protein
MEKAYSCFEAFSDGTRIYNRDETATTTVQKPKRGLSSKRTKQVSQCTSGERGVLITTCCIMSAIGSALPPVLVFPRKKKFRNHMLNGAPPGTLGPASASGWMNGELFPLVISSEENPAILVFDNHEGHLSIETLKKAKENGAVMVTLPPHCSHWIPRSSRRSKRITMQLSTDGSYIIQERLYQFMDVASCVGVAFDRSMIISNIKSGFRKTGILLFDRNIFTPDDEFGSQLTS